MDPGPLRRHRDYRWLYAAQFSDDSGFVPRPAGGDRDGELHGGLNGEIPATWEPVPDGTDPPL